MNTSAVSYELSEAPVMAASQLLLNKFLAEFFGAVYSPVCFYFILFVSSLDTIKEFILL